MPKFYVKEPFELTGRPGFFIAGSLVEGNIGVGMFIHAPLNAVVDIKARIDALEFLRRLGGSEDIGLCLKLEQDELEIWGALNIRGETIEISEEG